ncbi:MAG TPA: diaminopimelate epimerase [Nitrospiria bacterium]|nr:diaminopimelate epimerase [Nitrospiria bacterium]
MRKIPFTKMSGSGNDFILIDNRRHLLKEGNLKGFIKRICEHRLSVGGDGVILIEPASEPLARPGRARGAGGTCLPPPAGRAGAGRSEERSPHGPPHKKLADFKWRLFNADGSEAEFSGNGGRCAARFAYLKKIAGRRLSFETLAGLVRAEIKKDRVKIQCPEARNLRPHLTIPLEGRSLQGHFIHAGVPHVVLYVEDVDLVNVVGLGRVIRHHSLFQPAGTNVNFVTRVDPHTVRIRTYERGVEDETLACGSGSVAAALITGALDKGLSPLTLIQRSGKTLKVHFRISRPLALPGTGRGVGVKESTGAVFSEIFLEGDAMIIYEGEMWEEAWK